MASILLSNVDLTIPIFDYSSQSLRLRITNFRLGLTGDSSSNIKKVDVLKNVNLSVKNGDRVGIIGPNGAGKSSFLRLISGIYQPTNGSVEIVGKTLSILTISDGLEPVLTGRENIYRVGLMRGYSLKHLKMHETKIIEFSGLKDSIDLPVRTYSSGMQLRLVFSIVTSVRLNILLLDEFFAAGDEDFRNKSKKRIDDLIENAEILMLASHSIDLVKQYCNRLLIFENGQVRESNIELI